jgi:hypothetical protein
LPAENPITDAIAQITQEYKRLKKDAPKKQAPRIRAKSMKEENSLPLLKKTLADLGINPKPRPWVRHTNDEMGGV